MIKLKTYKFKLKVNKQQENQFNNWLNVCRFIYNLCLDYKKTLYSSYGISINKNDIQKELKDIKIDYEWINNVHSQTIQDVTDRLFKTYDNFFKKKKGFPKFAKKDQYKSFTFKQGIKLYQNNNRVFLPKIGEIKYKKSCDISGEIKQCHIIKEHDGWYISLVCQTEIIPLPIKNNVVGLDLGIKDLIITSNNKIHSNPKTLYKYEKELIILHRNLSRKKRGSNNRRKNIKQLKKLYVKISRIRKDYNHKITTNIINENQVIICEDLKISNMLKNHKLSKSISDVSWRMIIDMLEYKSKLYGRTFIKINPQYTSKTCNKCEYINEKLTLKDREWTCPSCNEYHHRDVNAALNIKNKGIIKLMELGHNFNTCGDMDFNRNLAQESNVL